MNVQLYLCILVVTLSMCGCWNPGNQPPYLIPTASGYKLSPRLPGQDVRILKIELIGIKINKKMIPEASKYIVSNDYAALYQKTRILTASGYSVSDVLQEEIIWAVIAPNEGIQRDNFPDSFLPLAYFENMMTMQNNVKKIPLKDYFLFKITTLLDGYNRVVFSGNVSFRDLREMGAWPQINEPTRQP